MLQSVQEPHCMNCKVPWNNDMLIGSFTKSFFQTELRKHKENIYFEREKALLPNTQQQIREENLQTELQALMQLASVYGILKQTTKEQKIIKEARVIATELGRDLTNGGVNHIASSSKGHVKPRPICRCIDENCRGFIMSNNWTCGICDTKACKDCLKRKTEGHMCIDDDKETCKLLLNNTKPCPKCGVMISKIDGCDQMWCVMCHTTFDWRSGSIVTTNIHNPHYYEWMRRMGRDIPRDPNDIPQNGRCEQGELPRTNDMYNMTHLKVKDRNMVLSLYRIYYHIRDVEVHDLERRQPEQDNTTLRKSFLRSEISEEEFKREIFLKERARERNTAIRNVMDLFSNHLRGVINDIYYNRSEVAAHMTEVEGLAKYCNDCFADIGKLYGVKPFMIKIDHDKNLCTIARIKGPGPKQ